MEKAIYVSAEGDDQNSGTREHPLATVKKAISLISSGGGIVALLSGTYREEVRISPVADASPQTSPLLICAAPDQEVIFDGGIQISEWENWNSQPSLYVIPIEDKGLEPPYVWDDGKGFYLRLLDARSVQAYPASCALLDSTHILVATRNGQTPAAAALMRSQRAQAFFVQRPHTAIEGIKFKNYLGSRWASAIAIRANDVEVKDCEISRCVKGITVYDGIERAHISHCKFYYLEEGIDIRGVDTVVKNCIFEGSHNNYFLTGAAPTTQENCGIKIYAPAKGADISECLTIGFWYGILIKTWNNEAEHPIFIRHNTFLDGLAVDRPTDQRFNYHVSNIVCIAVSNPDESLTELLNRGSVYESNYFFFSNPEKISTNNDPKQIERLGKNNKLGPNPFENVSEGKLNFKPNMDLPFEAQNKPPGAGITAVDWQDFTRIALLTTSQSVPNSPASFHGPPACVSSEEGALISAQGSGIVSGKLIYREIGNADWKEAAALENSFSNYVFATDSLTKKSSSKSELLFALIDGSVKPQTEYEFKVKATGADGDVIQSAVLRFRTIGGGNKIFVSSKSDASGADGSEERPFNDLQTAFNHALPGDSILMREGIYTMPAMLAHGGTKKKPLTLIGSGADQTIMDGGSQQDVLLELAKVKNVMISGIGFRWFRNSGLLIRNSREVDVRNCKFINHFWPGWTDGIGISVIQSPKSTISQCIFTRLAHGIMAVDSPGIRILRNTSMANMFSGVYLVRSCKQSQLTGNSLTFSGNQVLGIEESNPQAFASFTSNFNNYGTVLRSTAPERPENDFLQVARYKIPSQESKQIILFKDGKKEVRFYRMADWQKFSNKDSASIFAEPQYVDPVNGDYRLLPDSPNILNTTNEDKRIIGAEPEVEKDKIKS